MARRALLESPVTLFGATPEPFSVLGEDVRKRIRAGQMARVQ